MKPFRTCADGRAPPGRKTHWPAPSPDGSAHFLVHGLQFRHPLSDIARHALSIARLCWEALKRIASQKDIASVEADFTLLFEVEQPRSLMGSGA
jgi:hypothetical protein